MKKMLGFMEITEKSLWIIIGIVLAIAIGALVLQFGLDILRKFISV